MPSPPSNQERQRLTYRVSPLRRTRCVLRWRRLSNEHHRQPLPVCSSETSLWATMHAISLIGPNIRDCT